MMHEQHPHEMQLTKTHPTGAEEWACPTCGRRFVMQWPPSYRKIVLARGDEHAIHNGGKGGLSIGSVRTIKTDDDEISDESLRPWLDAFDDVDFGNWLDGGELQ